MVVEIINTLNDKGQKYRAVTKENVPVFQFGIAVPDYAKKEGKVAREVIEVSPKAEAIHISVMGKEKEVDAKGLEEFLDNVSKLKALQEEEAKLVAELV